GAGNDRRAARDRPRPAPPGANRQCPSAHGEAGRTVNTPKTRHTVATGAARLRHVFVKDLEIDALLGIYPEEKARPQRILVNLDLSVKEGNDPTSDDI